MIINHIKIWIEDINNYIYILIFFYIRYIKAPNGQNITKEFLETGAYQIEVMKKKYPAKMYLHSPFDPHNKRLQGIYVM